MQKIKRFFECLVPISNCNLRCDYCYVIQENRRDIAVNPFRLSPEDIGRAFSVDRVGGICLISMCGFGETLIPKEMPKIIYELLKQGHFVNVTNNGTMTDRFEEIVSLCPKDYLKRLLFSFSLHYIELKKRNLLGTFANNVNKMWSLGSSILVQINMYDRYMPLIDEIKEFSKNNFGAYPQVALTRRELFPGYEIMTDKSFQEYVEAGRRFNSPLFDFTVKNFNKKRDEFCYAGDYSFRVDLGSGEMKSCYCRQPHQNIYDNLNEPIIQSPIGNCCTSKYCVNSSHFISLGDIPEYKAPSYAQLRDRKEASWFHQEMLDFLSQKMYDNNEQYSLEEKESVNSSQQKFISEKKKKADKRGEKYE